MKQIPRHFFIVLLAALCCAGLQQQAEAREFTITPGEPNEVVFTSHAPGETFDGRTDQISGMITFNPENLNEPVRGRLVVDVQSLDTGISLRNNHMFDNHLHPEQYPTIEFELHELLNAPSAGLTSGQEYRFKAKGNFSLHGVTRTIETDLKVEYSEQAGTLEVTASFPVVLNDYDIPRPQFLFLRLAEEQDVEVHFVAHAN